MPVSSIPFGRGSCSERMPDSIVAESDSIHDNDQSAKQYRRSLSQSNLGEIFEMEEPVQFKYALHHFAGVNVADGLSVTRPSGLRVQVGESP